MGTKLRETNAIANRASVKRTYRHRKLKLPRSEVVCNPCLGEMFRVLRYACTSNAVQKKSEVLADYGQIDAHPNY